jgi:hypothetical protein
MKNKTIERIRKGFTKKDASYLIAMGVMSGLLIGSTGGFASRDRNDGPGRKNFDHESQMQEKGFKDRRVQNQTPQIIPSPSNSASISPNPSTTPKV